MEVAMVDRSSRVTLVGPGEGSLAETGNATQYFHPFSFTNFKKSTSRRILTLSYGVSASEQLAIASHGEVRLSLYRTQILSPPSVGRGFLLKAFVGPRKAGANHVHRLY